LQASIDTKGPLWSSDLAAAADFSMLFLAGLAFVAAALVAFALLAVVFAIVESVLYCVVRLCVS
jgi:hypothetical protein